MILTRTKNTIKGSFWGILSRIISTLFPFFIRTIIIKYIGQEYVGLNSLFTSVLQVLNLTELGLTSAIVFSMYKPIAEDDVFKINALLNFYRKVYFVIGVVILLLGTVCLPFIGYLINGTPPEGVNIYLLYMLFLANTVVSYFFFAYKEAILTAYQRIDVLNIVKLITFVLQYGLQVLVLLLTKNLYFYVLIMVITTFLRGLLNAIISKKMFPMIKREGNIDLEEKNKIKINMFGVAIGKVCTVARGSCDNIIISMFLSLTALTIFDNYFYIISAITAFLTIIENALISGVGNSIATETKGKNYNDFSIITFLFMWIVGVCTCCLLTLFQPFMKLWVGIDLMLENETMILFPIYFYIAAMSTIPSVYLSANGLWWKMKLKSISEVISNLTLNCILVRFFGISGILIATICTLFFISFIWATIILFKEYFGMSGFKRYLIKQIIYLLVVGGACSICWLLCNLVEFESLYAQLFFNLAVALVVPNTIFFFASFKTVDFVNSKRFVYGIFRRKKQV